MSQLVDYRSAPTKRGESLAAAAWPTLAGTRRPPAACLRVGKEVSRKCLGRVSKLACETARRVLVCVKETAAAGTAGKQQEDEGNVKEAVANAAREGRGQPACALQQRVQPDEEDGEVVVEGDLPGCGGQKVDEVDQLVVEVRPELLGREVHLGVVQHAAARQA